MSALDMPDFGPAKKTAPLRVLVVSPGHFELDTGRVSEAAGDLVRQLKRRDVAASLLASAPTGFLAPGMRMAAYRHRPDEMLAAFPERDGFSLASRDAAVRDRLLADLLDHFQPDVVHFQDIGSVGLDACGVVRARGIPVVLTLQEDIAAAPEAGAAPADGASPASRFARRRLLQLNLSDADALVVAHRTLAERLASGGVSGGQIHVIANPGDPERRPAHRPPGDASADPAAAAPGASRLLKARRQAARPIDVGVFLSAAAPAERAMIGEAMEMLPVSRRRRLRLVFYGAPHWAGESEGSAAAAEPNPEGVAARLRETMARYDWVVVPSLDGGGSLLPFQEAASLGVPFLHPGRDDLPDAEALGSIAFDPDAVAHLAHCLLGIADGHAGDPAARQAARRRSDVAAVDDYLDLYRHVIAGRASQQR